MQVYEIASDTSIIGLADKVNEFLKKGYWVHGNIISLPSGWGQAIVTEVPDPPEPPEEL